MTAQISPLARLALAYAPARAREPWLGFLALDARLAGVVRSAREPMLGQLRLAWWRDRLSDEPANWPAGEPLLASLHDWGAGARGLAGLVDGWEALLGDPPLPGQAMQDFAQGRVAGIAALAGRLGTPGASLELLARTWALADLSLHLGDPAERVTAQGLLAPERLPRVDRTMRPLAILAGLSQRAVRRDSRDGLDGLPALLAAIRLGFTGR